MHFLKIILDKEAKNTKMIAFLIPHKDTNKSLQSFVVSTDEIEALTGIDFFSKLPDNIEEKLEKSSSIDGWKF